MRYAHSEAQKMFRTIGEMQGFRTSSTYKKDLQTDGVWWEEASLLGNTKIPFAAIEVVNSEDPKQMKGSLITLAEVSPALGILMIHELDIRRRFIRDGKSAYEIDKLITKKIEDAWTYASRLQQRIDVWSYEQLAYIHSLATKKKDLIHSKKFN